jgi:putative transposase
MNLTKHMNRDEHIEDNLFYHVYNRGNDRERIFGDEADYAAFLTKLTSLAAQYNVAVPVYTLMPNHYHLIVQQQVGGNVSRMMGALATSASKRYNLKYGHIGHLFQGPFRYKIVSEDALWYVACYIHLNPVRAGLVKQPEEWRFSNFAELSKRFPSTMANPKQKETFISVWQGYTAYVRDILKDEQMEKEFWAKVKGYLPPGLNDAEGFLRRR